jgi:thymidylate synthase ThyX
MFDGIGADLVWDGTSEIRIPDRMDKPRADQMQGTPAEQLTELCGRCCYDSLGSKRSRPSDEYIKHILEVGHSSIAEHYNVTILLTSTSSSFIDMLSFIMLNRPWVWVTPLSESSARITMNMRVAIEFEQWTDLLTQMMPEYPVHEASHLAALIKSCWHDIAPRFIKEPHPISVSVALEVLDIVSVNVVEPETDAEKWISLYVYSSRGASHELVRHGDFTAMCLAGDSLITFVNKKGVAWVGNSGNGVRTIKWLYDRWKNPRLRAVVGKLRPRVLDEKTGCFTHTKILDVLHSGVKPCFRVELENGKSITCTKDHKIFTNEGWQTLASIAQPSVTGNGVTCWDETTEFEIATNGIVVVDNGLYKNREWLEQRYVRAPLGEFASESECDSSAVTKGKSIVLALFSKIKSITYVGEIDTYDLVLEGPNHGFVANGIVVHNSQRSTRFVNESKSPWTLHPLMQMYIREASDTEQMIAREETNQFIESAKDLYKIWVKRLIPFVKSKIDPEDPYAKTTARKQARGAARGLLGNALETDLVFSANVMQWKHMVRMRAADAADGEIRFLFQKIIEVLRTSRYADSFTDIQLSPSGDGVGMSLTGGGAE